MPWRLRLTDMLGISTLLLNKSVLALGAESLSIRLQVLIDDRATALFVLAGVYRIDLQLANLATAGRT